MTPFGSPVVPELYNQKAGASASVAATAIAPAVGASDHIVGSTENSQSVAPATTARRNEGVAAVIASTRSAYSPEMTRTSGSASAPIPARSAAVNIVDSGTGTTPARMQPRNQQTNAGSSLRTSSTRAPDAT